MNAGKPFIKTFFSESSDFRVQIFNTLGILGAALGIIFGTLSLLVHPEAMNIAGNYAASVYAVFALWRANKTGAFKKWFLTTVVVVFFLIFPGLFFMSGGITSGMPCFFVFAVVFTVIMLEGRRRTVLTLLEIALYTCCFIIAISYPDTIVPFPSTADMLIDIVVACVMSSIVLAFAIYRHIVIYDRKQLELEKANEQLHSLNHMKTEFLQDIKHEIKNPLLIVSLTADLIHTYIDSGVKTDEAHTALNSMQNEAMRLGRMINGMVEMATMSGSPMSREKIDFAAMLQNCAETSRLQIEQKNIKLLINIAPDLPHIYAEAEQLVRVPHNLLTNAIDCTHCGEISLDATAENNYITVTVRDTGEGVPEEILPRVFERGVSGKGGKGYGLSICKTIVEAHGGEIRLESEPGKGTAATFSIPVYSGQNEAREDEL